MGRRRKTGDGDGDVGDGGRRARARRSDCWKLLNRKRELSPDIVDAQPQPHTLPIASASHSEGQYLECLLYFIHAFIRLSAVVSNIIILILQRGKLWSQNS